MDINYKTCNDCKKKSSDVEMATWSDEDVLH